MDAKYFCKEMMELQNINLYISMMETQFGSAIMQSLPSGQTFTDVTDAGAVVLATATDGRYIFFKRYIKH